MNDDDISATLLTYQVLCPRKAWLFIRGIRPEGENELVQVGKSIHRHSFQKDEHEVKLGEFGAVDFLRLKDGELHEIKKSDSRPRMDRIQVGFYMDWLNRRGIGVGRAVLHYQPSRKTRVVEWSAELQAEVNAIRQAAKATAALPLPPAAAYQRACEKCSYWILCETEKETK